MSGNVKKIRLKGQTLNLIGGDGGALTEQEKQQMVQDIIASMGAAVVGRVEEDGTLVLEGLAAGTYKLYYETASGSTEYICDAVVT